jgi:hypothetical protein
VGKKYGVYLYVGGVTYKVKAENENEALHKGIKALDEYLKTRGSDAAGDYEVSEWDEERDEPVLQEL